MLSWLRTALPDRDVTNFTTDWNSGINLNALLDFCRPGLAPQWRLLDPNKGVENNRQAMKLAKKHFGIPMVLDPEYLSSPYIDELSGMTYLSYFINGDGPGYTTALSWVRDQLPDENINNFTTDWNDGRLAARLAEQFGARIDPSRDLDPQQRRLWQHNWQKVIDSCSSLAVEPPLMSAKDLADPEVDYIGPMSFASNFRWLPRRCSPVPPPTPPPAPPPRPPTPVSRRHVSPPPPAVDSAPPRLSSSSCLSQQLQLVCPSRVGRVNQTYEFRVDGVPRTAAAGVGAAGGVERELEVEVVGPGDSVVLLERQPRDDGAVHVKFVPRHMGMHQIHVRCGSLTAEGCPGLVRVLPECGESPPDCPRIQPCAVGSIVEVNINPSEVSEGTVRVTAFSPWHRRLVCPVTHHQLPPLAAGTSCHEQLPAYTATFQPDQPGRWQIHVTYDDQHIHGSPFGCLVFDPNAVRVGQLEGGGGAGRPLSFLLDARDAGWGRVQADIVWQGRSLQHQLRPVSDGVYRVTLAPPDYGKYRLYVYFNGLELKDNPFKLRVDKSGFHSLTRRNTGGSLGNKGARARARASDDFSRRTSASPRRVHHHSSTAAEHAGTIHSDNYEHREYRVKESSLSTKRIRSSLDQLDLNRNARDFSDLDLSLRLRTPPPDQPYDQDAHIKHIIRSARHDFDPSSSDKIHVPRSGHRDPKSATTSASAARPMHMTSSPSSAPSKTTDKMASATDSRHTATTTSTETTATTALGTSRRYHTSGVALSASGADSVLRPPAAPATNSAATATAAPSVGRELHYNRPVSQSERANTVQSRRHHHYVSQSRHNHHHQQQQQQLFHSDSGSELRDDHQLLEEEEDDTSVHVPVGARARFAFRAPDTVQLKHVDAAVIGPSGRHLDCDIESSGDEFLVSYTPTEVGEHEIHVSVRQVPVSDSPFRVSVFDASAIVVSHGRQARVGQHVQIEIDGSRAGSGSLEIAVNGGHVSSYVRDLGEHRFVASFVPHQAADHTVDMTFNGLPVPGSPWVVLVTDQPRVGQTVSTMPSTTPTAAAGGGVGGVGGVGDDSLSVALDHLRHFSSTTSASFDICGAADCAITDIGVDIIGPAKRSVAHKLTRHSSPASPATTAAAAALHSGAVLQCSFSAQEVGTYHVHVTHNKQPAAGSPFVCKCYDAALIHVSDIPTGVVGQPCQFRVDASQAGEGQLEISINDGEVPNHVQVLGGGRCLVTFTPLAARPHTVQIKFNGRQVPGSAFTCHVQPSSRVTLSQLRQLELVPVNRPAQFGIAVDGAGGSAELAVSVRGPTPPSAPASAAAATLPVSVTGSVRAGFTAQFTPRQLGAHTVLVEYNGTPVSGTPFTCKAYDASRVTVADLAVGQIGKTVQFTVDAGEAGEGNLEIAIAAGGRNIPTQVHPQGSARFGVSFVPLEPVDHTVSVSFNKQPIPGSPFTAPVQSDPNQIVVKGTSLASTPIGKPARFTLSNIRAGTTGDVQVHVDAPGSVTVATQVVDSGADWITVQFTPSVPGEHRIHALFAGAPVPGSPFACKVFDVAAIRVREVARGVVGRAVSFLVETLNAGPGNLEVTVNSGQVPTSAQSQGQHRYAISFTPKHARLHHVELKFNGQDVPGSPFTCTVVDASQVTVTGAGLGKVPVNCATAFHIDTQTSHELSDLSVSVLSPLQQPVAAKVSSASDTRAVVEYTPSEVGDHYADVSLGGVAVTGSPFIIKCYDVARVKVTDVLSGAVSQPVYFCIDASQAGAGNLEIIVSVNGHNVPNYVQSEGNARFRVNFRPQQAAQHTLSVKFNGQPVPGSPFTCNVCELAQLSVSGEPRSAVPAAAPVTFTLHTGHLSPTACSVIVTAPSGSVVPARLSPLPTSPTASDSANGGGAGGQCRVEFCPVEVGPHSVTARVLGEEGGGTAAAAGAPVHSFTCNVYNVSQVLVSGLDSGCKVGQPVTFSVDASQAGEGTLELVVTTGKATVRAEVAARSRGQYDVTFVPTEAIPHFINVTFNEVDVPGSPFKCEPVAVVGREARQLQRRESQLVAASAAAAAAGGGESLKYVVTGSWATFDVDTKALEGDVSVEITGPRGEHVPHRLAPLCSGAVQRVEYRPLTVGTYQISVSHRGRPLQQGGATGGAEAPLPRLVEAADPSRVRVAPPVAPPAAGQHPLVATKEAMLKVDTSHAGRGVLTVSVRAAGQQVPHTIRDLTCGHYQVIFTPQLTLPHKIDVKYNGVPVPGCPLELPVANPWRGRQVTADGAGLYQARCGVATSFVLDMVARPGSDADVVVSSPAGLPVPVKCYQQKDGNMLVEFTPNTAGAYTVEVLYAMKSIWGSPFTCQVFDASQVLIDEPDAKQFNINQKIGVQVSRVGAGLAELDVAVTSPLGKNLPIDVVTVGDCAETIEFRPTVPGNYRLVINYGGEEIPGSPLNFLVEEEGVARASGDGLVCALMDAPATFRLHATGLIGEPQVRVDGPDSVAKCVISEVQQGEQEPESSAHYLVTYTPREVGVFDVSVLWNGTDIAGSPFHPRVVQPKKVRLIGGWESLQDEEGRLRLAVNEEKTLVFDISEAGPGKLRADLRDSSNAPLCCRVDQPGYSCGQSATRCRLALVCRRPGQHLLYLYWSDTPLPGSPRLVLVDEQQQEDEAERERSGRDTVSRVVLRGHGLTSAQAGKQAHFTIDGAQVGTGTGVPEASLSGARCDVPVSVQPVAAGVYRAVYTAPVAGTYMLSVTWAGREVSGCPLRVCVTSSGDASRVLCSGEAVVPTAGGATVGRQLRCFIDTRQAGVGELTAQCVPPSQQQQGVVRGSLCELTDHQDGTFTLSVKPQQPGRHQLHIMFAGEHVPGSPFAIGVGGAPDASRVRVYGPGVEPGVLSLFQSRFMCDTRGAGAGQLTVRIRGPKGAFRVEMQRQSQKDRVISCKYDPTEPGDYRIEVRWAGSHVPGSPFPVAIFDTQEELSRYLHGGVTPAMTKMAPGSEFYGSIYGSHGGPVSWRGSQVHL